MSDNQSIQKLPNLTMTLNGEQTLKLTSLKGKNVVLYFYPKDNTPGCTQEGKDFRDHHKAFTKANTVIFGISKDTAQKHEKFKAKHEFPFDLIADTEGVLCDHFGVISDKTMFGKVFKGIERSTFVFNAQGKLAKAWRKVKVSGHVAEVLDFIQNL